MSSSLKYDIYMSIILFDKDGVLVDSEKVALARSREFMTYKGLPWREEDLLTMVGGNVKRDAMLYKKWFGEDFDVDAYNRDKAEYFKDRPFDYKAIVMSHAIDVLKALKKQGHRMSLVSSSNMNSINLMADELNIREYFDYLITGDDFKRSKPDPEVYNFAKSKYDASDDEFFVIEDSNLGIEAGKRANLKVIALKDIRYGIDQSAADYIIDDLIEILDIVNK